MEHDPLLNDENPPAHLPAPDRLDRSVKIERRRSFVFCIFALEFCMKFGVTILELPMIRLVESMVCHRFVDTNINDIKEEACKIAIVQNKVALILGCKLTLDALPCLLTVLFYGYTSNAWGRRPVIMLQISGRLLSVSWIILIACLGTNVPPELIWLSSLFLFIGGGRKAQVSTIYTSFCDVVPEQERTRLLAFAHASEGLAGMLAYPIASILMNYSLLIPFAVAIGLSILEYIVLWNTLETSPFVNIEEPPQPIDLSAQGCQRTTIQVWRETLAAQINFTSPLIILKHRGLNIILALFLIKRIAFASEDLVSLFVSEILHRRISETFWFQVCGNFGMLLTLSVLLPSFTRHLQTQVKDIWIICGSLVNVMVGTTIMWCGRSLTIFCIGLLACDLAEGIDVGLLSLGSYIVGEAHYGTFFPLSSMLGVAGELLGGPLIATMYSFRDSSGKPLGYCFLLSVVLFGLLLTSSYFINTNRIL